MLYSFQEGYMKPPYPYSFKVRGWSSKERYAIRPMRRVTIEYEKVHAGCRVCDGYGYAHASPYYETEDCVCVVNHNGTYSKKAYRFWN
jgi:hypothetical protein